MTKQEAIEVLEPFRKAFRALDQTKAIQAFNVLVGTPGVATSAVFNSGFPSALGTLRSVFDEIDRKLGERP